MGRGFFGYVKNEVFLSNLNMHKEGLIVRDRIVLGADYIFVLDSQYSRNIGDRIMVCLDNLPVESDSDIMAHVYCDNGIYRTPALFADILHIAHRVDCTIVHARITTGKYSDTVRAENEKCFACELGFEELDFPYRDEETAVKIMMDEEKRHEPYKARTIITRHRLGFIEHSDADDKKRDKEWENFNPRLAALLESHKLTLFEGKNEETEVGNPFGFDEAELMPCESYEEFLSCIQVREFPQLLNDKPYEQPKKGNPCYTGVLSIHRKIVEHCCKNNDG